MAEAAKLRSVLEQIRAERRKSVLEWIRENFEELEREKAAGLTFVEMAEVATRLGRTNERGGLLTRHHIGRAYKQVTQERLAADLSRVSDGTET